MLRILIQTFLFIPIFAVAQFKDTVALNVQINKFDTAFYMFKDSNEIHKSYMFRPLVDIEIKNVGINTIEVYKKSILSPGKHFNSYINILIEEVSNEDICDEKPGIDSMDVAPVRCNICFFGKTSQEYINNKISIDTGASYSIEELISCYSFISSHRYRVQLSLDTKKTGLRGKSEWIYFQIPDSTTPPKKTFINL